MAVLTFPPGQGNRRKVAIVARVASLDIHSRRKHHLNTYPE